MANDRVFESKESCLSFAQSLGCPSGSLRVVEYSSKDGSKKLYMVGLGKRCLDPKVLADAAAKLIEVYGTGSFRAKFNAGLGLAMGVIARVGTAEASSTEGDADV